MKTKPYFLMLLGLTFYLAIGSSPLFAAPPQLPPRPTVITQVLVPGEGNPRGAWIELRVQQASTQSVVVQWQDGLGNWNDVNSWRGEFDEVTNGVGKKTWWLDERLFGAPNFRWVVYDSTSGRTLGTSPVFAIPKENRQTASVDVVLPSDAATGAKSN